MRKKFETAFDIGNILGVCILIYALITKEMTVGFLGVCIFFICELFQFINNFIDRQDSRDLKYEVEPVYKALDLNKLWEIFAYISVVITLILSLEGKYYARGINNDEQIILKIIALLSIVILLKIYYFGGFKFKVFDDGIIYSNGEWIPFKNIKEVLVYKSFFGRKKRVMIRVEGYKGEFLNKNYNVYLKEEDLKYITDKFGKDMQ